MRLLNFSSKKLLNEFILAIGFIYSISGSAATVQSHSCDNQGDKLKCEIQLSGTIEPGERLLVNGAGFNDQLFLNLESAHEETYLFRQWPNKIQAPRIYHLTKWQGSESVRLHWISQDPFFHERGLKERKLAFSVISEAYPLRRVIRAPFITFILGSILMIALCLGVVFHRSGAFCGWFYPKDETRWWGFGSLIYLFLSSPFVSSFAPSLWSVETHTFLQKITLAIVHWSVCRILFLARIEDSSQVEIGKKIRVPPSVLSGLDLALLTCLIVLSFNLIPLQKWYLALSPIYPFLLLSVLHSLHTVEWKKVSLRSGFYSCFVHGCLLALGIGFLLSPLQKIVFENSSMDFFLAIPLAAASLATLHKRKWKKYLQTLLLEIRTQLRDTSDPLKRMEALMEFIASEWGVARTSIIVIEGSQGLMLACSGPDSIVLNESNRSRNLGPFLRRVVRGKRSLYAPLAEELGKDLQKYGLKHSSLAIPFLEGSNVFSVICIMAEEGERISPYQAIVIEGLLQELRLEVVSAIKQKIAEDRSARLWKIAKHSNSMLVEQLDRWGNLPDQPLTSDRMVVGLKLDLLALSPLPYLDSVSSSLNGEIRSLWTYLAEEFEFLVKEQEGTLLFISPKNFRDPFLNSCDPFYLAGSLLQMLERQSRVLIHKDAYSILGSGKIKAGMGKVTLHWKSDPNSNLFFPVLDPKDQRELESLIIQSRFEGILSLQHPGSDALQQGILCREVFLLGERQIFSILPLSADRKEFKKLELGALLKWKAKQTQSLKKAA